MATEKLDEIKAVILSNIETFGDELGEDLDIDEFKRKMEGTGELDSLEGRILGQFKTELVSCGEDKVLTKGIIEVRVGEYLEAVE